MGRPVSSYDLAFLVVVWVPLVVVWLVVLVDVVRRRDLSTSAKALWMALCTLVWPAMLAYLLLRPTRGRLEDPEERDDAQSRLVNVALQHEAGDLDDAEMESILRALRAR